MDIWIVSYFFAMINYALMKYSYTYIFLHFCVYFCRIHFRSGIADSIQNKVRKGKISKQKVDGPQALAICQRGSCSF